MKSVIKQRTMEENMNSVIKQRTMGENMKCDKTKNNAREQTTEVLMLPQNN